MAKKIKINKIDLTRKRKKAPIKQLIEAGKIAQKMLVERGLEAKESKIKAIFEDNAAPTLPGVPAYLPRKETLQSARKVAFDLFIIWQEKTKKNIDKMESVSLFFTFAIKELKKYENRYLKEHRKMESQMEEFVEGSKEAPVLGQLFNPLQKFETTQALIRFFVDCFAVAIMVKNAETTGQFASWFFNWTEQLELLWDQKTKNDSIESTGSSV